MKSSRIDNLWHSFQNMKNNLAYATEHWLSITNGTYRVPEVTEQLYIFWTVFTGLLTDVKCHFIYKIDGVSDLVRWLSASKTDRKRVIFRQIIFNFVNKHNGKLHTGSTMASRDPRWVVLAGMTRGHRATDDQWMDRSMSWIWPAQSVPCFALVGVSTRSRIALWHGDTIRTHPTG